MPLYEFKCAECGEVHNEIVKLGTEIFECPACGGIADKIMSVPNFVLKGNTWAKDNYGLKKTKKGKKK